MEVLPDVYMVSSTSFGIGHFADCSVYMIDCGKELVLIDSGAGIDVNPLVKNVRDHGFSENNITDMINTHCHYDHAGGDRKISAISKCSIAIHENGVDAIEKGDRKKISSPPNREFETVRVTKKLKDSDRLRIGKYEFKILHTPGHTDDSICILVEHPSGRILFSGDTVWALGQPGIMSVDSDFKAYHKSIERVSKLEIDILLPGHGIFVLSGGFEHINHSLARLSSFWSDFTIHPAHPFWPSVQVKQKLKDS